jgi:hypothetical protein
MPNFNTFNCGEACAHRLLRSGSLLFLYILYIFTRFWCDQTTRVDIYIFTTETLYKISSRALLLPALRTGKFTVECPCRDAFRHVVGRSIFASTANRRGLHSQFPRF